MINESDNFKVHIMYYEDEDYEDDYVDLIDSLDEKILDPFIIGVNSIDQAFIKLSNEEKRWIFKPKISNKTLYREIEDQIREEARNNVYDNEDKKLLKLFVKRYGKRTEEEIAEIFNEKENIVNQSEIITPQIIEEKPIIKPYENLKCGIIMPNSSENEMYLQGVERYNIDKIIEEMYTSSAINGVLGEVSKKELCFYDYNLLPFNNIKDNLLSDFNNYKPYFNFIYQTCDLNFIIFCIYETLFKKTDHLEYNFIRYLVPIIVNENKEETVLEALLEYFNNISGRVSNEYQRRIDAFQKQYNR